MPNLRIPGSARHLHATDLRATTLLAAQATHAVTAMTEGVHQSVWHTLGMSGGAMPGKTRGMTGLVYRSINGITRMVSQSMIDALIRLEPLLQRLEGEPLETPERAAFVAALNGVMGERLAGCGNPLATSMTLRLQGQVIDTAKAPSTAQATPKILLVIHGLCMNELQWTQQHQGQSFNHATTLAKTLGYTPVYVRYNSGLHVSHNGQALAAQLEGALTRWPVPVEHLTVLAHSMGGLVIRSALHYGAQAGMSWPRQLKNIVFLGTPHHGAPLERAGNWVDALLGSMPHSRPLAQLGKLRSTGVTDLRYGYLLEADWQGFDRFHLRSDSRQHVPLPDGVRCFAVAATLAAQRGLMADRLLGDGLVPLHSALGQHPKPTRQLHFASDHQYIAYRTGHLELLRSQPIAKQLLSWLGTP